MQSSPFDFTPSAAHSMPIAERDTQSLITLLQDTPSAPSDPHQVSITGLPSVMRDSLSRIIDLVPGSPRPSKAAAYRAAVLSGLTTLEREPSLQVMHEVSRRFRAIEVEDEVLDEQMGNIASGVTFPYTGFAGTPVRVVLYLPSFVNDRLSLLTESTRTPTTQLCVVCLSIALAREECIHSKRRETYERHAQSYLRAVEVKAKLVGWVLDGYEREQEVTKAGTEFIDSLEQLSK